MRIYKRIAIPLIGLVCALSTVTATVTPTNAAVAAPVKDVRVVGKKMVDGRDVSLFKNTRSKPVYVKRIVKSMGGKVYWKTGEVKIPAKSSKWVGVKVPIGNSKIKDVRKLPGGKYRLIEELPVWRPGKGTAAYKETKLWDGRVRMTVKNPFGGTATMGVYRYQNGFWVIEAGSNNVPRGGYANVTLGPRGLVEHYKIFWDRGASTKVTGVAQILWYVEA